MTQLNKLETKVLAIESIDKIREFEHLCFTTDHWKEEDWKDLLTDGRATYYALMDGEKIVGDLFTYNWSGELDYLKIMNVAVHPDYRKKGLATKLMALAKKECEDSKLSRICAETRESNIAMKTVFEQNGYTLNEVEENCYENPVESGHKYVYIA
jgi:ribosomal protein S18 acetylase RimI-like enzyme